MPFRQLGAAVSAPLPVDSREETAVIEAEVAPLPFVLGDGIRIAFSKRMPELQELEDKKTAKGASAGKGRRLALILPVIVLIVIGSWYWATRGSEPAAQASGEPHIKSTLHLETFVLNLADTNQRSYLRVGIDLGLNLEPKRGEEPAPVAAVRDTILSVLADAKVDDLMTAAGKAKLKESLLHALQERMPQLGVEEVYFTEFLIQR